MTIAAPSRSGNRVGEHTYSDSVLQPGKVVHDYLQSDCQLRCDENV
jgi:hypothetical protein